MEIKISSLLGPIKRGGKNQEKIKFSSEEDFSQNLAKMHSHLAWIIFGT